MKYLLFHHECDIFYVLILSFKVMDFFVVHILFVCKSIFVRKGTQA